MNEALVKTDLRTLIVDNEATLTSNLTHQGTARVIKHVTRSNLTPIKGYYFILITVLDARERSRPTSSKTVQNPTREATYRVQLEVADQAIVQSGDTEAYEQMHQDFATFVDRIIKLLRDQTWIGSAPKRKLVRNAPEDDREIIKRNLSGTWKDTEDTEYAGLYSQIVFSLVEECINDAGLYS